MIDSQDLSLTSPPSGDFILRLTDDEFAYVNELVWQEIRAGFNGEVLWSLWDKVKGHNRMSPPCITNDDALAPLLRMLDTRAS